MNKKYIKWLEKEVEEAKDILKESDTTNFISNSIKYMTLLKAFNKAKEFEIQ